ncbi:transporter substrate-binding domain-containing protein [Methylophaga sp.]|uniref:transporter substrate-binding domain-containing protein n=1 Tax=Methylophaga sp. TaxID=2024840 RepID=UPI003F69AF01
MLLHPEAGEFKRFLIISALLLLTLCSVVSADQARSEPHISITLSAEERDWIKQHPEIIVGGGTDWAPFDFVSNSGDYTGLARDYLELISAHTGLNFRYEVGLWSENLHRFRNAELDLLPAVYRTPEREQFMNFSSPYHEMLDYFFIRDDIVAESRSDLDGMRVAVPKDDAHNQLIISHFPSLEIIEVKSVGDAIDAVLEGRAELIYDNYAVVRFLLEKLAINSIVALESTRDIGNEFIHIATQKNAPELASIIRKGLDAITISQKRTIHDKWFAQSFSINKPGLNLSDAEQTWLDANPSITFTGDPNWLPYEAFTREGQYIGIVAEYLKLITDKLGLNVDFIHTSNWTESVALARQGKVDVISETRDSTLSNSLNFTQSYLTSPIVIVMRENETYVEGIEQISNRRLAMIKDYGYVETIKKAYPDITFLEVDTIQSGLTAVSTGKIDSLIATLAQASYHISELSINNIRIVGETRFKTELAFAIHPDNEPLVSMFNRAIADISLTEKQQILENWGKYKFASRIDYGVVAKVVAGFLLFLIIVLYWNRKLALEVKRRRRAEAQTQKLIDCIPLQVAVTDYGGGIITVNPKALEDYKVSLEDIGNLNMLDFYVDPEQRQKVMQELREKGSINQKIIQFKRFDGEKRSMMVSIMPIQYYGKEALLAIAVDLTDRLEIEEALREAKEKADVANKTKSEFLANMSHEIRTPMNAIIGFTELLFDKVKEPKLKSYVKTIQSAGNDLLLLINDILDLSKIEADKLEITKSASNPHLMFDELAKIFQITLRTKGVELLLEVDPNIPSGLMLDVVRLRQVLVNLIGNAVKFTETGSITLRASTVRNDKISETLSLRLDIEDTGIGIPESQLNTIFEEFHQTQGQNLSKFGGTGLGLSISHRLVTLMGGTLTVESKQGVGSTFTVILDNVTIAASQPDEQFDTTLPQINFESATILLADDIENNRLLIREIFTGSEILLLEAENGRIAVEMIKNNSVDLVLMDLRMPVMDGYQAAAKIKQFSPDMTIIALTASVMKDEFDRLKSEHFDDYIRKPVKKQELFAKLANYLKHQSGSLENVPNVVNLTEHELSVLPDVLDGLKTIELEWKRAYESNDISDIKRFSAQLLSLGEKQQFRPVINYAQLLLNKLEVFDISGIGETMTAFPDLCRQLEEG